ncbi:hypothetical protein [Orenia marismortui]|uniref:hypothetical protein n=1 Tax=Orenia marismortui TaxID=46469 RepID=UPI000368FE2A|nr:hypothetical protein [Orenia marismortui]
MNKKRKLGLILMLLIVSVIFTSCMAEKVDKEQLAKQKAAKERVAKVHREALEYLKDIYNEEFVIKHTRYIKNAKVWELTAAPKVDQDLEFFVRTGGMFGSQFLADYGRRKLIEETKIYYRRIVNKIFKCKHRSWANMDTDGEFGYIPTVEEVLEKTPEDTYVNVFIYIFEDVITDKEKKEEFLSNVMELLEYLRGQNLKWATIQISIYDEEFFRGKDIDYLIKETNFFHKGSKKLKYNALEYQSYEVYGLYISRKEFLKINTVKDYNIKDLEKEIYKQDLKFLRE